MISRGIRGATTVTQNDEKEILAVTRELVDEVCRANAVHPEQVTCMWITVTHDINATFPASAVRANDGWNNVAILCAQEIPVPGALPLCIRLMVLVNTQRTQAEMVHVYLRGAVVLRPDWSHRGSLLAERDTIV
jgi:chorismate mutase